MGRVHRTADEEVDVRRAVKQLAGDAGRAVAPALPRGGQLRAGEVLVGVLEHARDRDHGLGRQIDAGQVVDGRQVASGVVERRGQLAAQIARGDPVRRAAADDLRALLRKELAQHQLVQPLGRRRADHQVRHAGTAEAEHRHGGVVARAAAVEAVALRGEHPRDLLGRQVGGIVVLEESDDVFALPAEGVFLADAGVDRAVAHHDEHVVFLGVEAALVDLLALDHARGVDEIVVLPAAQHDGVRVVEPRQLHVALVADLDDGERRIGDLAHAALRERADDGVHTVLDGHAAGAHRREDLRGEGGEDVRLDAAAQPVGEHADGGAVAGGEHHAVAAELLAGLDQADVAGVDVEVIRHPESPP